MSLNAETRGRANTRSRERRRAARHGVVWSDMFANLHTAYGELTRARFELERQAARVEEARDLLQLVIESMSEALLRIDSAGRVVEVNGAAERVLERPSGEILGRTLGEVLGNDALPSTAWDLIERSPSGSMIDLEVEVRAPSGRIVPLSASVGLVRDKRGKIVGSLVVARDITERKRAEESILRLNDVLSRRAEELVAANQELEAFSYSVSHDLRAPLRGMDGFSRILLEEFGPSLPEEAQHYLGLVRQNAQQMGTLIDDLLTFSRLSRQPLSTHQVEPAEIARQVFDEAMRYQSDRRVELVLGEMPECRADPALLRQVYANLIGNAIKFTRTRDVARVEAGARVDGGQPVYYVRDNGVGFDMRYVSKIFGVFQRLHRAEEYEGTGVGMAIVQRIVHRHGGRVWAESELGRGAAFYFTLGGDTGDGD